MSNYAYQHLLQFNAGFQSIFCHVDRLNKSDEAKNLSEMHLSIEIFNNFFCR